MWEIGEANSSIDGDPTVDVTDASDNGILGTAIGGLYENRINDTAMIAMINCANYENLTLSYWCSSYVEHNYDEFYCEISIDGTTWIDLGVEQFPNESEWTQYIRDISTYADNADTLLVRFRLHSDGSNYYRGINMDDIVITGYNTGEVIPEVVMLPNIAGECMVEVTDYPIAFGTNGATIADISIEGIDGKVIQFIPNCTGVILIDMSMCEGGLYNIIVSAGNTQRIVQVIKE